MTYDNYFDFVDRLQDLYQKGMRKFLNEEISYISNEQIDNAFWTVKNKRNATKQQIQRYFRELKFFTNSAFSFLDTHNEELFKRNTKVLSEVVQMWQALRLKTDTPNQFLGDMFELFLDDGIKQSEGQFFTPLPICKFIVSSLPLAQKIAATAEPLKAIDYACGSGHFLNEYAHQIKELVGKKDLIDYYSQIIGIEKEDRLVKVAKVAAYMHGQEEIKILDADALAAHPEIQRESFDLLVANPPFAVEGFLQTLSDTDKKEYQLTSATGKNSNTDTIECFFLERLYHLMASGGIIGVIVRDSISYNTEAVYTGTREILLQYFDIVSIAELGSETFWKTTTKTVVLFLRRKAAKPEPAEHYRNRVDDFFEGDDEEKEYQDHHLIKAYCNHIDVSYEEYIKLFGQTSLESLIKLLEYDIFNDYKQAFSQSTEIKNLKKSSAFKKKTPTGQSAELEHRFIAYLHNIEKEKFYYFILAHEQKNKVLIVNAPNTSQERKRFLGYEWSDRRGNEGIIYKSGDTVNDIVTSLFDPEDLDNDTKINTAIKRNFIGQPIYPLPEHCHYANLTDMLDFSRTDFNKALNLNPQQNTDIESKWEQKTIEKLLIDIDGNKTKIQESEVLEKGETAVVTQEKDLLISGYTDKKEVITDLPLIVFGDHSCAFKYIDFPFIRGADGTQLLKVNENELIPKCFYYLIQLVEIPNRNRYERHFKYLKKIKIPLPPFEEQRQIVNECESVDQESHSSQQTIATAKEQIEEKVNNLWSESRKEKLDNLIWINTKTHDPTLKPDDEFIYIDIETVGKGNGVIDFSQRLSGKNAPTRARRIAKNGNTIISTVRPNLKGFAFIDTDNINDCVFSTGFAVLESKNTQIILDKVIYYFFMFMDELMQQMKNKMGKSSYPSINKNDIKNYQFPVPPLDIQQQLVAEVKQLEEKITQAQAVIDKASERKNAILAKYL